MKIGIEPTDRKEFLDLIEQSVELKIDNGKPVIESVRVEDLLSSVFQMFSNYFYFKG